MKRQAVLVFAWSLLLANPIGAQVLTGNIIGAIRDESGAVLPGVTVAITSPALPIGARTMVTNEKGEYRFTELGPGAYALTVTIDGFSTYKEDGLLVALGGTTERNVTLKVAAVAETITVSGESPMVDPRKVGATFNMTEKVLENLPTMRDRILELGKWSPGVAATAPSTNDVSFSVLGSGTGENSQLYDGVQNTYPATGEQVRSGNADTVQEMQITTLGASAEYQISQGAVFNVIFKSGTNQFRYEADVFYRPAALVSAPITVPCGCPLGATGYHQNKFNDFSGHVGGPFKREKVWFYTGFKAYVTQYSNTGVDPSLPIERYTYEVFNKVTWQINDHMRFAQLLQNDDWFQSPGLPSISRPYPTVTISTKTDHWPLYSSEFTDTLNNSTLLTVRVTGVISTGALSVPVTGDRGTPFRVDSLTNIACCGAATLARSPYSKQGQAVKLNRYLEGKSVNQDLRFGVQLEEGWQTSLSALPGGVNYSDNGGAPDQATFRKPFVSGGRYASQGVWGEDQLAIGRKLTVTAGVRVDRMHAVSQDLQGIDNLLNYTGGTVAGLGDMFTWTAVSPRIGFNLRLGDNGKAILRGTAGRAYRAIFTNDFANVHPGLSPITLTRWNPAANGYTTVISVTDPIANLAFDRNLRAPYTDQYSIGLDRELVANLATTATYVHKYGHNLVGWTDIGGVYGTQAVALPDGRSLTVAPLLNATSARKYLRTNGPGFFTQYDGLLLTLEKRMSQRWRANVSYTYSKSQGLATSGNVGQDPNDYVNATGRLPLDRPQMFLATGDYQIPKIQAQVSASFMGISGVPYAAQTQVSLPQGRRAINIAPIDGSYRLPAQKLLSLRFDKYLFNRRAELLAIVTNALQNESYATVQNLNFFTPTFGASAGDYIEPRRLFFQLRVGF